MKGGRREAEGRPGGGRGEAGGRPGGGQGKRERDSESRGKENRKRKKKERRKKEERRWNEGEARIVCFDGVGCLKANVIQY